MCLKEKIIIAAIFLSATFFIGPEIGVATTSVIINEVAWMGTVNSVNDEWIELYNPTPNAIDLTGWTLKADDDQPKISLTDSIAANGYFLLERTDDSSVPGINADQIYTGALTNDGEYLKLFNSQNNLIDQLNAQGGWPAGDSVQKLTMEKADNGTWQNSQIPGGTPKASNSVLPESTTSATPLPTSAASPISSPSPSPTPTENFQYSQNVLINEFLPYPEKDNKEWLELINNDSAAIDLTGWQIDDDDNSTSPQAIPENTTIKPGEFLIISFNKSTLNNDGDKIRLLWPDDQVVHAVAFSKATQGQAVAKFNTGWLWTNQPTPGQTNKKSSSTDTGSVNVVLAAAEKINPIEESVLVENKTTNQSYATPKITASSATFPLAQTPTPSLTASVSSSAKESSGLKTILALSAILLLAILSAGGLIYFRRKIQVDSPSPDD